MPQIFQVLRCYKCLVFQVHQTKKSNKWECKLCGEKQSIKRHYGIGTAKDCRFHVQKLNCIRGEVNELNHISMENNQESDDEENITENVDTQKAFAEVVQHSKWSTYIVDPEPIAIEVKEDIEPMHFLDAQIVLEMPKKSQKRIRNNTNVNLAHIKKSPEKNASCYTTNESPDNKSKAITKPLTVVSKNLNAGNDNSKHIKAYKKFVPPVINRNSKWCQYTEDEENITSMNPDKIISQNCNLFSLCDDTELDNILNI